MHSNQAVMDMIPKESIRVDDFPADHNLIADADCINERLRSVRSDAEYTRYERGVRDGLMSIIPAVPTRYDLERHSYDRAE